MKVLIIGGTGHVGQHLVCRLLSEGLEVAVLTTGSTPVPTGAPWDRVEHICHRFPTTTLPETLETAPPDCVIDMLGSHCTYELFRKQTRHIVVCGSLWMYGEPKVVPTPESARNLPCPFDSYTRRFAKMQTDMANALADEVRFTAIMPPNISGPGKIPLEGLGGRSVEVHRQHAAGKEVILPDGPDCLIGPCDADDIAQLFHLAVLNPEEAAGEIFNAGAAYALTATEFIHALAHIYETTIPIEYVPWETYTTTVSPDIGAYWHFKAHMCPDITKAARKLGYLPQHTPEESLARAVAWMRTHRLI